MNNKTKGIGLPSITFNDEIDKRIKAIGILSIAFIVLAILVETNLIATFDSAIYSLLTMNMTENLTKIELFITFLGDGRFITPVVILSLIAGLIFKRGRQGAFVLICVFINNLINGLLKSIFHRPRPEILQLTKAGGFSFPSGHTMAIASLCGLLIYLILRSELDKNIKYLLITTLTAIAFLVGISRIYLGVHYASDVLGGFIATIILLLVEISIIEKKEFF